LLRVLVPDGGAAIGLPERAEQAHAFVIIGKYRENIRRPHEPLCIGNHGGIDVAIQPRTKTLGWYPVFVLEQQLRIFKHDRQDVALEGPRLNRMREMPSRGPDAGRTRSKV